MNNMLHKSAVAASSLLLVLGFAAAQVSPEKVASSPPKLTVSLPFKLGETLAYEVSFSRLIFSGVIGELKLTVARPLDSPEPEMIELKADAVSKGFFPALFGIKIKDRYISLVDQRDFCVHSSTKLLEEGKERREQKSVVNRDAALVNYTDRDLTKAKGTLKVR